MPLSVPFDFRREKLLPAGNCLCRLAPIVRTAEWISLMNTGVRGGLIRPPQTRLQAMAIPAMELDKIAQFRAKRLTMLYVFPGSSKNSSAVGGRLERQSNVSAGRRGSVEAAEESNRHDLMGSWRVLEAKHKPHTRHSAEGRASVFHNSINRASL